MMRAYVRTLVLNTPGINPCLTTYPMRIFRFELIGVVLTTYVGRT